MLRSLVHTVKVLPAPVLEKPAEYWIDRSEGEKEELTSAGEWYASREYCIVRISVHLGYNSNTERGRTLHMDTPIGDRKWPSYSDSSCNVYWSPNQFHCGHCAPNAS